jgi:hypothetical protein
MHGFGLEPRWQQDFLNLNVLDLMPTHPLVQWVLGSFPGVKWLGHMSGHPPRFSVEGKKEYSYHSTPPPCPAGML